jgi:hypothetical protein
MFLPRAYTDVKPGKWRQGVYEFVVGNQPTVKAV